jgi:lipoprotein LpqS
VRLSDIREALQWRSVIAIVAVAWLLAGAAGWWLVHSQSPPPDPVHAVLTSASGEFAVNADHVPVDCLSPACPRAIAAALLPQPTTVLVALGATAAVTAVADSLVHQLVPPTRGPPRGRAGALTGQDLLTRLCLARH